MKYYVYEYLDPTNNMKPIYVGKGSYGRLDDHRLGAKNKFLLAVINKILDAGDEPVVKIIARFLSEKDAFEFERNKIMEYGRRDLDTGNLCNFTFGGEGQSGYIHTEETKKKMSSTHSGMHKGKKNNFYGKKHAQKVRDKITEKVKKPIICVDTGIIYDSISEAAIELNLKTPHICRVLKGRRKRTGGYRFKYAV